MHERLDVARPPMGIASVVPLFVVVVASIGPGRVGAPTSRPGTAAETALAEFAHRMKGMAAPAATP